MPQTQYNLHLKGFVGGADFDRNYVDYVLAIQAAGVSRGRNGFRKDKGGEKLAESEEVLQKVAVVDNFKSGAHNAY